MVICSLILRHQPGHSLLHRGLFVPPPSFSTFNFELLTSSSPTFQCAARLPRPGQSAGACPELLGSLDFSSLGLTFNFQPSTFNCVFFPSPHLCALCVLCGKNSLSFRSSLIPRHSPLATNSFTIRTSETPLPQLLYNPYLQAPLGSAGNKGLITPLESALTKNSPVTPVESALTKTGGWGHSRSSLWIIPPLVCRRFALANAKAQSSRVGRVFRTSAALGRWSTGSSLRIRPSRKTSTRFAYCAMSCSCVTSTMVNPLSCCPHRKGTQARHQSRLPPAATLSGYAPTREERWRSELAATERKKSGPKGPRLHRRDQRRRKRAGAEDGG